MKLTRQFRFRVVALVQEPYGAGGMKPEEYERRMRSEANAIKEAIERHVDGVSTITAISDTVCNFCRSEWETDEAGVPVCCNKAISEWQALQPDSQQFGAGA